MDDLQTLSVLAPGDTGRMDWEDIAQAINAVLARNGYAVPHIGECNRSAMKKVLAGVLALEQDSAELAALRAGGVENSAPSDECCGYCV